MTKLLVHEFRLGDTEDPEIYAALPLMDFMETEKGIWCKTNSDVEMYYEIRTDMNSYGYQCRVMAEFSDINLTHYLLKYSGNK